VDRRGISTSEIILEEIPSGGSEEELVRTCGSARDEPSATGHGTVQ